MYGFFKRDEFTNVEYELYSPKEILKRFWKFIRRGHKKSICEMSESELQILHRQIHRELSKREGW